MNVYHSWNVDYQLKVSIYSLKWAEGDEQVDYIQIIESLLSFTCWIVEYFAMRGCGGTFTGTEEENVSYFWNQRNVFEKKRTTERKGNVVMHLLCISSCSVDLQTFITSIS